ncbi:MAG: PhnD/SsuA/transferrin family substrate-binding protein, partial [Pseudomonadota bacterium]
MLKIVIPLITAAVLAAPTLACDLTIGVVPQFEHRRTLETWGPLIGEFETATGCNVTFATMRSIPEFEDGFRTGAFDIAYMNPYHAIIAYGEQGYRPIVRSGRRFLQGVLVVAKDAPIQQISDLNGKKIAFPAPNALGASLLMRAELAT